MTEEEFTDEMTKWVAQYYKDRGWLGLPQTKAAYREFHRDLYDWSSNFCLVHNYPRGQNLICEATLPEGKVKVRILGCVLEKVEQ